MAEVQVATRLARIVQRGDGSQVKIVATDCSGPFFDVGKHVQVDVYRRSSDAEGWKLCSDRPHPNWRSMSVDEYNKHGRCEKFQAASHGEIFSAGLAVGRPVEEIRARGFEVLAVCDATLA